MKTFYVQTFLQPRYVSCMWHLVKWTENNIKNKPRQVMLHCLFHSFSFNPVLVAVWTESLNRKTWQLWHAGKTRFQHTRTLTSCGVVCDCEWGRGNRQACCCISIFQKWDRNTDWIFILQLGCIRLVQLLILKSRVVSLAKWFSMLTGRNCQEGNPHFRFQWCLCGPRSKLSWRVTRKQIITFIPTKIFEAMQQ